MLAPHRRFNGFYPETFEFFRDIRFNNDKYWFDAHRDDFEAYVKAPLESLVSDLEPLMTEIDPSLDVRPRRVVSRIYRDARYARGVPYRDHMWLSWKPVGKGNSEALTYYFFIEEDSWGVGLGLYTRVPEIQEIFRQRLMTEGRLWAELLAAPELTGFNASLDTPKRPKSVGLPPELERWYHARSFYFDFSGPVDSRLFSAGLVDTVSDAFIRLKPVYLYVTGKEVFPEGNDQ